MKNLSTLQKWRIAIRPFSLPASTMPVIFGNVLAAGFSSAPFHWLYFGAALLGIMLLHSAANMLNDVFDYRYGVDQIPTPVSGAVVRGLLSPATALRAALILLAGGSAIGIWLAWRIGPGILYLGVIGVSTAVLYTWKPVALKYHSLGEPAVFITFGILGALGAWYVQTGQFDWLPVIWSIPISLHIVAILHANNWVDLKPDQSAGISTIAGLIGGRNSKYYYGFLIFTPFVLTVFIILLPRLIFIPMRPMPYGFLLTLLALPKAWGLWQLARRWPESTDTPVFQALDGATAQLNLFFGLLSIIAVLLHRLS
ncbi:prenyltransferase [bacterium]|nr:prenyltransferase [bacterium]